MEFFPFAQAAPPHLANHSTSAVQSISPLEHPDWDALATSHPDFSLFYSSAWAKVLTETYDYAPNYFVTKDGAGIHSLLPLMEVDSWLTGRRGIALPFTDDCEPLCPDK